MRIGVYALAKNEAKHAAEWAAACADADVRVVTDTGSTDGTQERLAEAGVDVRTGSVCPWRWDEAHNLSMHHLPPDLDVAFRIDLDERPAPGWRDAVEREFGRDDSNCLVYRYVYSRKPDGSPGLVFYLDRCHARAGFRWTMPTHEGLVCWNGEKRQRIAEGLEVHHHRDPGKRHVTDLSLLQVAIREAPNDARAWWYFARELDYAGSPTAAGAFADYLSKPGGTATERAYALRVLARLTNRPEYLGRAAEEAPHEPDAWERLALAAYHAADWESCLTFARQAIAGRAMSHATDPQAKTRAHELASIALWSLGQRTEALPHAREAAAGLPGDDRVARNLADMEALCLSSSTSPMPSPIA